MRPTYNVSSFKKRESIPYYSSLQTTLTVSRLGVGGGQREASLLVNSCMHIYQVSQNVIHFSLVQQPTNRWQRNSEKKFSLLIFWSQSFVHYHFKLKMKLSLRAQKKSIWCGMQFLVLDFLSSAQLDHTNMYDFENCR